MKAVIFCDDEGFAARAESLLQRIGVRTGVRVYWTIKTWSVNEHTTLSEAGLLENADAHLILISQRQARCLFPCLHAWLNRWAEIRELEDAVIGVLTDSVQGSLTGQIGVDLMRLVQTHRLTLIKDESPSRVGCAKLQPQLALELEMTRPGGHI